MRFLRFLHNLSLSAKLFLQKMIPAKIVRRQTLPARNEKRFSVRFLELHRFVIPAPCRRLSFIAAHSVHARDKQSLADSSVFLCRLSWFFYISIVCIKANALIKFGKQIVSAGQTIVVWRPLHASLSSSLLSHAIAMSSHWHNH